MEGQRIQKGIFKIFSLKVQTGFILGLGVFLYSCESSGYSRCFLQRRWEGGLSKTCKHLKPSNPSCNVGSWLPLVLPKHTSTFFTIIKMALESTFDNLRAKISEMSTSVPYTVKQEKGSPLAWHHASVTKYSKKSCDLVLRVTYIPLVSIKAVGAQMLQLQGCLLGA